MEQPRTTEWRVRSKELIRRTQEIPSILKYYVICHQTIHTESTNNYHFTLSHTQHNITTTSLYLKYHIKLSYPLLESNHSRAST